MVSVISAGQALHLPAVLAVLEWTPTRGLTLQPVPGAGAVPDVATLAPGRVVVRSLQGPLAFLAKPDDDCFPADTKLKMTLKLRTDTGQEETVNLARVDLAGAGEQTVLELLPAVAGTWTVRMPETAAQVDLPAPVASAYAAARRAVPTVDVKGSPPPLAVDLSASMRPHLLSGLLGDVLNVVAGVCARGFGPDEAVPLIGFGAGSHGRLKPMPPRTAPSVVTEQLAALPPASGGGLAGAVRSAGALENPRLLAVTDGIPADLDRILAESTGSADRVDVTLLVLAESRYAADPDDRPGPGFEWREELSQLVPCVEGGVLQVVATPATRALDPRRAEALAAQLSKAVLA